MGLRPRMKEKNERGKTKDKREESSEGLAKSEKKKSE